LSSKKKWTIALATALLVLLSVAGYFAVASEYGSAEDPLVTLSYLNNVLSPQVMQKLDAELNAKSAQISAEIDAKVQAAGSELDKKIAEYEAAASTGALSDEMIGKIADEVFKRMLESGSGSTAKPPVWERVDIPAGKTVMCSIGCEILLRLGSATCSIPSGGTTGPVNLTDGTTLGPNKAYIENNLYLVTINDRGIYSKDGCTVFICGDYTKDF